MRIVKNIRNPWKDGSGCPLAVTIGKFDGIHRGHQELIRRTAAYAGRERALGRDVRSCVLSFDMAPQMILSKKERRALLEKMGIDILIECPFHRDIISMSAGDFIRDILQDTLHAEYVAVGEDFRFGYQRQGSAAMLAGCGGQYGFAAEIVPEVEEDGRKISSTEIRGCLARGAMEEANHLLGFPYPVTGEIIHGNEIGRTIGVPTANMIPPKSKLLPPNGVYFVRSTIGGKEYGGVTNIGNKPTVGGSFIGVETSYFDLDEDLYGAEMTVRLYHFSRAERKFDSLEELKEQIGRDEQEGRRYLGKLP